jgi:hypothetical protein
VIATPEEAAALLRDMTQDGLVPLEVASPQGAGVRHPTAPLTDFAVSDGMATLRSALWECRVDVGRVRSAAFFSGSEGRWVGLLSNGGDPLISAAFPPANGDNGVGSASAAAALWDRMRTAHAGRPWVAGAEVTRSGPEGPADGGMLRRCFDDARAQAGATVVMQLCASALELFGEVELPPSELAPEGWLDVGEGTPRVHVHLDLPRTSRLVFYDDARGAGWHRYLLKFVDEGWQSHLDLYFPNPYRSGVAGTGEQARTAFQSEREALFKDFYRRVAGEPGVFYMTSRPLEPPPT